MVVYCVRRWCVVFGYVIGAWDVVYGCGEYIHVLYDFMWSAVYGLQCGMIYHINVMIYFINNFGVVPNPNPQYPTLFRIITPYMYLTYMHTVQ